MICPHCSEDRHPVIEGDQNGRFVYTCGNSECHSFIKLHERSETPTATVRVDPPRLVGPTVTSIVADADKANAHVSVDALTASASKRLLEVESDIARLESLKVERSRLRAMLKAGNRAPRKPKSNVVPIARDAKKAAQ